MRGLLCTLTRRATCMCALETHMHTDITSRRQVGDKSSDFFPEENTVRRGGSFIYEEFLPTGTPSCT